MIHLLAEGVGQPSHRRIRPTTGEILALYTYDVLTWAASGEPLMVFISQPMHYAGV